MQSPSPIINPVASSIKRSREQFRWRWEYSVCCKVSNITSQWGRGRQRKRKEVEKAGGMIMSQQMWIYYCSASGKQKKKNKTPFISFFLNCLVDLRGYGGREKSQLNAQAHPCPPISFRLSTVWFLSTASPSCFNSLWKKCFRTYLQRAGCQATALSPRHAPDIEPSSNYNYNPNHKM